MAWISLSLSLLLIPGERWAVTEHVNAVEVNHVGRWVFRGDAPAWEEKYCAVVFWRGQNEWKVVDWRWHREIGQPRRDQDKWTCEWIERGRLRRVVADWYLESWTEEDVEFVRRPHPGLMPLP